MKPNTPVLGQNLTSRAQPALKKKLIFMHPEERRNIDFARVDRRQPPKNHREIVDVIKQANVRYFVDLKTKLLDFKKVKEMLGDLSNIPSQKHLRHIIFFIEDNYGSRLPWDKKDDKYDYTRSFYDQVCNVSDHYQKFELAKYIFKSDAYILLPRHLRYALTRYIAMIMIEIRKPYEPITDLNERLRTEDYKNTLVKPPADMDCLHYLQLLKKLLQNNYEDDIEDRLQQIRLYKDARELRDDLEELDRIKGEFTSMDDEGYVDLLKKKEKLRKDIEERSIENYQKEMERLEPFFILVQKMDDEK